MKQNSVLIIPSFTSRGIKECLFTIRLCIAGIDKFEKEDDSAVWLEDQTERPYEDARKMAEKIAKRLGENVIFDDNW